MDYLSIVIRILTYVVIMCIIRLLLPKLLKEEKHSKEDNGITYFNLKPVSMVLFIATILMTVILVFAIHFTSEDIKVQVTIASVIVCLIFYALSIMYYLWYICLDTDKIIYRNCFGKKRTIDITEITSFERKPNGKLFIYNNDKVLLKIDQQIADFIIIWLASHEIKSNKQNDNSPVVIRPARYMRVIVVLSEICFIAFIIFGLVTGFDAATIVFIVFSLIGLYCCIFTFTEKYTIKSDCIEKYTLISKKSVKFSEIYKANISISTEENNKYILFFAKDSKKPLLKISTYYENAFRLQELAEKKKWFK